MGWLFGKGEKSSRNPVDGIIQDLRSGDPEVCRKAADLAGQQRLKAAVPALVELLYLKDKRVMAAVARALGEIGDLRAIQHIEEATFGQEFVGGIPGFDTFTEDGGIVEVAEEDAVLEKALREAEEKLWRQPGAGPYGDQLGKIRMHTFGDFWRSDNILTHPNIQKQFTMQCAKRFFKSFTTERFAFEGWVKSIAVYGGKEALPAYSFADGYLLSKTLDEMAQLDDPALEEISKLGKIHFKFGGNATLPCVAVDPEPKWPRPSILRRCVLDLDGRSRVRFDELP